MTLTARAEVRDPTLPRLPVWEIQRLVGARYNLAAKDIASPRRFRRLAWPRMIAMYFAWHFTDLSLAKIGQLFGGRDHSTVFHATARVTQIRGASPEWDSDVAALKQILIQAGEARARRRAQGPVYLTAEELHDENYRGAAP